LKLVLGWAGLVRWRVCRVQLSLRLGGVRRRRRRVWLGGGAVTSHWVHQNLASLLRWRVGSRVVIVDVGGRWLFVSQERSTLR
jgi:hypothetical protein